MAQEERQLGIVRWFSARRGYGFITVDSTGDDLFVHHTAILSEGFSTLKEGDDVEFYVVIGNDNRVRAMDVARVSRQVNGSYVSGYGNTNKQKRGGDNSRAYVDSGPCYTCGKMGHFARDCVVEIKKPRCYACGKLGHFARNCPSVVKKKE